MANLTRIKNNQITDSTVNAAAKLQDYSVTSGKLANSLVYGSDLTVSGNLTVNGTTTAIDTVNTLIEDPIITLADGQVSGAPTVDIGVLGLRGSQNSSFLGWNEGNTEFAAILTTTTTSNTTVAVTAYGNFHANSIVAGGNLSVAGNITGAANFTGNVTAGNLLTPGVVSAAGNITAGSGSFFLGNGSQLTGVAATTATSLTNGNTNLTTALNGNANLTIAGTSNVVVWATTGQYVTGEVSASGNVTSGNVLTGGLISATGNATAGNVLTGGLISATGNLTAGNVLTAGDIVNASANTQISMGTGSGIVGITSAANTTQFLPGGQVTLGGASRIQGGTFTGSYLTLGTSQTDLAQDRGGNVTVQLGTGGTIANTWTFAQSGALLAPGAVSAVGNVTGGNVLTGGLVSATGTATAGNLATGGTVSATANITGGNILTGGLISAGGNITSATNVNTPNVVGVSGLTLSTGGNANILLEPAGSGNIIVNNRYINGLQLTPLQDADAASKYYVDTIATTGLTFHEAVFATTNTTLATATGGTISYTQPNGATNGIGAYIQTTGTFTTIDTANVQTVGTRILVKNEANAVFNGVYTYTNATAIVRSTDTDQYGSQSAEAFSINDYFFTTNGNVNAGAAFVVDAPAGTITFGTSNISFAQFSSSQTYTANVSAGLVLVNQQFNAKVDNNTTAFDGTGNISVKAGANLTTPNIGAATGTSLSVTGAVTAGTDLSAVANVVAGNVNTGGLVSATGNVTSGNVNTGNVSLSGNVISALNVTGNIAGGNILTVGLISATSNVTGGNVLTGGLVSATGNVTGNYFFGNGASLTGVVASSANAETLTGTFLANNVVGSSLTAVGNLVSLSVVGNTQSGNILTAGLVSATGNVTGGNLLTSGSGGAISGTGNITGGNILTGGVVSATANITAGNILTGGLVSATGTGTFGNVTVGVDSINSANGRITFNSGSSDTDLAFNGLSPNVFYIDAGSNTASFGSATQTVNAIVAFNSTNSILTPVGNTGQRPGTGVTGMLRFNSTSNALEIYDNSAWTSVGVPVFTVIADEQFSGDGSNVAFTLGSTQTTNSCIVSINGVVQIPGTAYSVAGTDPTCVLTFTEAPASGDLIDVREITTTTTVTSISNSSGNAVVAVSATTAQVNVTGDLSVSGSILGGNISGTAIINGTSNVSVLSSGGNILVGVGGANIVRFTGSGIENAQANATGNIGNATSYFNTIFAQATSAQYADLAEMYAADAAYAPGTVVSFGGANEVTQSNIDADRRVAGVVSTNPSYIMNAGQAGDNVVAVALTGRVPTSVTGTVAKGDLMVSNGDGTARAEADPRVGTVIGKALADSEGNAVIEVVVGRF